MIAVDAMGGDRAPQAPVLGALRAARRGIAVTLYGDKKRIVALLDCARRSWAKLPITIKHCPDSVAMHEEPSRAVVRKKSSSLVCAVQAVKDGEADAIVSAGNSGAMLAAGTLILGRVRGLHRPAIGTFLPTKKGSIFCLDLGANADCKPSHLAQFALIGSVYVRLLKKIEDPKVALLSNGEEAYKGSMLVKGAYSLLKNSSVNFVGNLEPRDMFDDHADVLVSDGFSGNVMLKTLEATAKVMVHWFDQARKASWLRRLLFLCVAPLLIAFKKKTDGSRQGGALLLGVTKPMVLAHGASDVCAMMNAIQFAHKVAQKGLVPKFNGLLEAELEKNVKGARFVVQKVRSIFRSSGTQ